MLGMPSKTIQIECFRQNEKYYKDHPVPKVLNAMNYDVFVLGNHEFNFGMKALDEILKDIKAKKINREFLLQKKIINAILHRQLKRHEIHFAKRRSKSTSGSFKSERCRCHYRSESHGH